MVLSVKGKEYKIEFAYKPVLKKRIISRLAEITDNKKDDDTTSLAEVEDLLLFIPELVLVGLQKCHRDEFGYDYNTDKGYEEQLDKVIEMIEEYCKEENSDFMSLFSDLQTELLENGFLSSLFRQEQKRIERVEDSVNQTASESLT